MILWLFPVMKGLLGFSFGACLALRYVSFDVASLARPPSSGAGIKVGWIAFWFGDRPHQFSRRDVVEEDFSEFPRELSRHRARRKPVAHRSSKVGKMRASPSRESLNAFPVDIDRGIDSRSRLSC